MQDARGLGHRVRRQPGEHEGSGEHARRGRRVRGCARPRALGLWLRFACERPLVHRHIRRPAHDAVGRHGVPFSQDEYVIGDDLFDRRGHHMSIADDVGERRGGAGQLVQGGSRAGLQGDIHAEHRNERERQHRRVPRLPEHEVHGGRGDQHDGHRIEHEAEKVPHASEPVARHPAVRSDACQATSRVDAG